MEEVKFWRQSLTDRERKEILFAETYKDSFEHGTDEHNRLMMIAHMAELLDRWETDVIEMSLLAAKEDDDLPD